MPAAAPTLEPMSLLLSGQSVNFSLKRMVSMQELIRPRIVQSGLSVTLVGQVEERRVSIVK